jgi:hypothetical protein
VCCLWVCGPGHGQIDVSKCGCRDDFGWIVPGLNRREDALCYERSQDSAMGDSRVIKLRDTDERDDSADSGFGQCPSVRRGGRGVRHHSVAPDACAQRVAGSVWHGRDGVTQSRKIEKRSTLCGVFSSTREGGLDRYAGHRSVFQASFTCRASKMRRYRRMSTRKLILASLVLGVVILVAFAAQLVLAR